MKLEKDDIKKSVADFYKDIANEKESIKVDNEKLNLAIGYSKEDLEAIPEEANMGLGCGNPQEKAKPRQGETVIDLGCGKGMDVFLARKKVGESGYLIGVDMTADMIRVARKIAKKKGFDNCDFRLGEIEHLPVADNTADLVISNCVINLSTDKDQVYREIFRCLKAGGRIGISDISLSNDLPCEVVNDPKMYGTWVAGALTLEKLTETIKQAGFVNIDIETKVVSDEYAAKWGISCVNLKDYLRNSTITAYKPLV